MGNPWLCTELPCVTRCSGLQQHSLSSAGSSGSVIQLRLNCCLSVKVPNGLGSHRKATETDSLPCSLGGRVASGSHLWGPPQLRTSWASPRGLFCQNRRSPPGLCCWGGGTTRHGGGPGTHPGPCHYPVSPRGPFSLPSSPPPLAGQPEAWDDLRPVLPCSARCPPRAFSLLLACLQLRPLAALRPAHQPKRRPVPVGGRHSPTLSHT